MAAYTDRATLRVLLFTAIFAFALHLSVLVIKTYTHPAHTPLAVFRVGELMNRKGEVLRSRPSFIYEQKYPLAHGQYGTDGQAYLFVAHDPWLIRRDMVWFLDAPSYRYGRILLPALAATTCGGNSRCIPYAILSYNLVFATMIAALAAALVRARGAHWGWGLALASTGALICATDIATTELCAQAFGLFGVFLVSRRRIALAVIAFALAALARETYVLVAFGFMFAAWFERKFREGIYYGMAVLPAAAWAFYVRGRAVLEGENGGGSVNLGFPLSGIFSHIRDFIHSPYIKGTTILACFVAVPLIVMIVRHLLALRHDRSGLALAGAFFAVLALCASAQVWLSPGGFARGLDFAYPSLIVCGLVRGDRFVFALMGSSFLHAANVVLDHFVAEAPP